MRGRENVLKINVIQSHSLHP